MEYTNYMYYSVNIYIGVHINITLILIFNGGVLVNVYTNIISVVKYKYYICSYVSIIFLVM